ncbi:exodeoxyribonuclease V subunit gamma [Ornithinimicrobium panacihumi]|uniref:exodeoxyribonuclease V subunit gamma n=1 Tax=Ornithinimicrobium panacihumi TaxID=2008449 RepID=UPI003F886618
MTLYVHRAASTADLAEGLAVLLGPPLEDPFAEEVVAVPARGVERWLAQRLSHRLGAGPRGGDGVCAGVRFLNPHSLVAMVLGIERDDPWHPAQLAWPVLRAIDASLGEPWAATLSTHLGWGLSGSELELRRGRRYAVARRLAGLLADYAAQRPSLLTDWREGGHGDGLGGQVPEDLRWQPELYRRVLGLVDAEPPDVRQARVVQALEQGSGPSIPGLELPGRLSLFGHTRIARSEVEVLSALGQHRDVHLWLPQASHASWDALAGAAGAGPVPRAQDSSGGLVQHPLLASLGRDMRELQRTLAVAGAADRPLGDRLDAAPSVADVPALANAPDERPSTAPRTLLEHLQQDLAQDHVPDRAEQQSRVIATDDRSIQVHACHGRARQIEVLRDVLADLLQHDPSLEPRDILVMCPDIDAFAPLVHAGFGLAEVVRDDAASVAHPAHLLRVRLADRAPLQTNPLLSLAHRLVELAGSRLTASQVLDLARSAPVRQRFGLDDDALERIGDWVEAVTIRWGLDAEHRTDYDLHNLPQNTWRAGLDRVLVGAALDGRDHDHLGTTLALDELDSGDIDLAGRLAELVDRLGHVLRGLREADGVDRWLDLLQEGVLDLADTTYRDAWQVTQLERELSRIRAAAGSGTSMALSDVRALLAEHGAGRATRSNFRTGTLTVCTMVPMRSVPHRVVCLVGMDDGVFPRSAVPDGDDVLARRPVTGERDARSEDRQLLLDAVMAAGDTLVITYTGADEHSGQARPPAVPLGELVDAVRATADLPTARVVTRHPLQPFDPRNLGRPGLDGDHLRPGGEPFSYDPAALAGATAREAEPASPAPLASYLLPERPAEDVQLDDLLRFFDNPARAFLRSRVGVYLPEVPELAGEGIPIELDGLQQWAIGERILQSALAGRECQAIVDAELWRGELPPHNLGHTTLTDIVTRVTALCEATWGAVHQGGWGRPLEREARDVEARLPDGRLVVGTVPGLVLGHALTATYSTVRAKQRLRSWIVSLALAADGDATATSNVFGQYRWGGKKGFVHASHGPHESERARELLAQLVDLRDRGLREVLPLPLATTQVWAETYLKTGKVNAADYKAGTYEWTTGDTSYGTKEQHDPSWSRVHGGPAAYPSILGTPREDEQWVAGVPHRLGQLALRVWGPVLTEGPERLMQL